MNHSENCLKCKGTGNKALFASYARCNCDVYASYDHATLLYDLMLRDLDGDRDLLNRALTLVHRDVKNEQ